MTASLIWACLWVVAACALAILPSRRAHWPAALLLIACGVPLLGWITIQNGPVAGLACLLAGMSILRWPVLYLLRRLWRKNPRPQEPAE